MFEWTLMKRLIWIKAAIISGAASLYETVTGAIVSFIALHAKALKKLVVNIEPVQDLHGYDAPWPPGGGKNKFNIDAIEDYTSGSGATVVQNGNGSVTVTAASSPNINSGKLLKELANLVVGETYTITFTTTGSTNYVYLAGTNESWDNGTSKTITQNMLDGGFYFYASGANTSATISQVMIRLSSVSDAVFAPYANECLISGWTGCEVWRTGKNLCEGSQNFLIGIDTEKATVLNTSGTCLVAHVVEGETYTFSNADQNRRIVTYWDEMPTVSEFTRIFQSLAGNTFTAIKSGLVLIYIYNAVVSTETAQIERSSTATDYEPFRGNSYSVTWEDEVFGGSAEVVEGKRINDRTKLKLLSSFAWQMDGTTGSDKRFGFPYSSNPSVIKAINQNGTYTSNMLAPWNIGLNSHEFGTFYISNSWIVIQDKNSHFATLDDFKDWLDSEDVYLVYKIATPVETAITPTPISTQVGTNTIWADAGDVEVTYYAK